MWLQVDGQLTLTLLTKDIDRINPSRQLASDTSGAGLTIQMKDGVC